MKRTIMEPANGKGVVFETQADRGYTVRASYLKEPRDAALVEIFRDGALVSSFQYPAYKIWNIAAHFSDIIDSEIEQTKSLAHHHCTADGKHSPECVTEQLRRRSMAVEGVTEEDVYETRQNGAGLGDY